MLRTFKGAEEGRVFWAGDEFEGTAARVKALSDAGFVKAEGRARTAGRPSRAKAKKE